MDTKSLTYFMLAIFFANTAKSQIVCPPLQATEGVDSMSCLFELNEEIQCGTPYLAGTSVIYTCKSFYTPPSNTIECLSTGNWSASATCVPECGKRQDSVGLIMHGTRANLGEWPWAASLHIMTDNTLKFLCGATLVSDNALITAAHCVSSSSFDLKIYRISLGSLYQYSPLNEKNDTSRQLYQVKEIIIPDEYQNEIGNYGSDIAILFLNEIVTLSSYVRPACLPWNIDLGQQYPNPGDMVFVAGWGLDENQKVSKFLKFIKIPIISKKECFRKQLPDFKKYITYTRFCAGFFNGTKVNQGDSGSGMLYYNKDKWVLVGIVSVVSLDLSSKRISDAVFTKVPSYIPWLYKHLFTSTKFEWQ